MVEEIINQCLKDSSWKGYGIGVDSEGLFDLDDEGGIRLPAPELAPPLTPGGEGERWMWAAASVTADNLVLPDGEEVALTGVEHLGHLVELAAGLQLGSGGGRRFPRAPQLLLTAEALERFGITLPEGLLDAGRSRDDTDRLMITAGAKALAQARNDGYQSSEKGFQVSFRMWIQDDQEGQKSRSVQFVVVPAVGLADRESRIFEADAHAVARRAQRFTDAIGIGFTWTGAVTGQHLYKALHPPGGKARTPIELVKPIAILRRSGSVYALSAMTWTRPMLSDEKCMTWAHGYDLRAAYLSALNGAVVGMGSPEHHPEGRPFDKKTPGLWKIVAPEPDNVLLPLLIPMEKVGKEVWVFTPLLAYLRELGQEPEVLEAYVWNESRRAFETWAKHVDMARMEMKLLKDRYPADDDVRAVENAVKSVYQGMVGRFARVEDRNSKGEPTTPWHRPDFRGTVVSLANVNLHRKLARFGTETGRYPIAVFTDEAIYTSDEADPITARPKDMKMGLGLGQWDVSRSGRVSAELIKACEERKASWFEQGIPK